ncbi:MAG: hypothetical protein IPP65_01060 [Chlorobi bacterium]|nr:hypothetical protein [Chlorobiota bacterium]
MDSNSENNFIDNSEEKNEFLHNSDEGFIYASLEARLSHIEELVIDLHEWIGSEHVSSLGGSYRRLYSQLVANDFEQRYAAQIVRMLYDNRTSNDVSDQDLRALAINHINTEVTANKETMAYLSKNSSKPYILALVGPSGAGKTTMMYKLAVRAVLNFGLKVKVISSDTYKIGSVEGIQTIADILNIPFGIAFEPEEIPGLINESEADLILLDTAGRSDSEAREELYEFISAAKPNEIHLVLSATMSRRAIQETAALFLGEKINCLSFTKIDEAPSIGGVISSVRWMGLPIGYISNGTAIPDDLLPASDISLGSYSLDGVPPSISQQEGKLDTHV